MTIKTDLLLHERPFLPSRKVVLFAYHHNSASMLVGSCYPSSEHQAMLTLFLSLLYYRSSLAGFVSARKLSPQGRSSSPDSLYVML